LRQLFLESDSGYPYFATPFGSLAKHISSPKFGLSRKDCADLVWFEKRYGEWY